MQPQHHAELTNKPFLSLLHCIYGITAILSFLKTQHLNLLSRCGLGDIKFADTYMLPLILRHSHFLALSLLARTQSLGSGGDTVIPFQIIESFSSLPLSTKVSKINFNLQTLTAIVRIWFNFSRHTEIKQNQAISDTAACFSSCEEIT